MDQITRFWATGTAALAFLASAQAHAEDVHLRVVDVGNGLCVVGHIPGGHSILYDAGDKGDFCLNAVTELVPEEKIDLVVLSHSDADHISELPSILSAKRAGTIVFPGDNHINITQAIKRERTAIAAAKNQGAAVWKLATKALPNPDPQRERVFQLGDATATIVAGWSNGDKTRGPGEAPLPTPEHNNALSIVVRLEYHGNSVLLTGDTVGRFRGDPSTKCAYAERIMVSSADEWPVRSDVLIGQHHGGDNASSNCFIRAVMPKFMVFSAGHKGFHHPTQAAADRIRLTANISPEAMFRTDRGDDEGRGEWRFGSIRQCVDQPGDDDVEIFLPATDSMPVRVQYRTNKRGC
jgi:competence protein ComEC